MKLYNGGRAPNPRRVQIFLGEKGIDIPFEEVDINALEQRTDAFAKKNPMKLLPVLELDNGTCISETVAICRYFEEIQPEPPLMGKTPLEKALIEMWQRRVELHYLFNVAMGFRHLHPGGAHLEGNQIPEMGETGQRRAREFMEFLDKELANRTFVAGDEFTIADITMIVAFQFMKPARIPLPEDLTNLMRWYGDVSLRPSVRA